MILTVEHILNLVDTLDKNVKYDYVSGGESKAKLVAVDKVNQKVELIRVNADGSEKSASMTTDILSTLSSSIFENIPFKFDNVLNGSGNVRSTMEALFAHTSEFYSCKINRVKHLVWVPQMPHEIGTIVEYETIEDKISGINRNRAIQIKPDLLPYLTAIRTKPFLLLAGISGTGKSRIVRKLAQATNDIDFAADYDGDDRWKKHNPTNFCLIQVKPNWHNSMDVVGFKSNIGSAHYEVTPFVEFIVKAWHYPNTPFFLCLDEMNLAPVEEYFAEFLSAIESRSFNKDGEYETDPIISPFDSFGPEVCGKMIRQLVISELDPGCKLENQFRKKGLTLPKNLIVMGTVNMDETTFSFSRKVLDRAMSIEMNEVNFDAFLAGETEEDVPLLTDCNMLLVKRPINAQDVKHSIDADKIIEYLKQVNNLLEGTPFKLGYRAANEAFLYVSASKKFGCDDLGSALDKFTVMKILSRIEGDDSKLKTKSGDELLPALLELLTNQFGENSNSISIQKLTEMNDILIRDHFVSFWG